MFQKSSLRKFALTTLSATFLSSEILQADAYEPGTFSFKPLNLDIASYTFGRSRNDSRITVPGLNFFTGTNVIRSVNVDAFRSPLSFGSHAANRNGYGYTAEFGYVIGWDTELFGRAGFSHERPIARTLVGDRSFNFKPRTNWGMNFGARRYFDCESAWKPFISAASGFTIQGSTKAIINRHDPFDGDEGKFDTPIGKYTLLKRKALLNLEIGGGTDYIFDENWAMSLSVALRYSSRGGLRSVMTPGDTTVPYRSPPLAVTYKDKRPRWTVPITLSLKTTGILEGLTKLAQAIPGMPSSKKKPGVLTNGVKNPQTFVGDITSDFKYTHYREGGPRYKIDVWQGLLVVPVQDFEFKLDIQRDTQSGASFGGVAPEAIQVPPGPATRLYGARTGASISEDRNELTFKTTYILKDSKYDLTLYYSAEDDFLSRGIGTGGTWNFNKNNTVLKASASVSDQTVKPTENGPVFRDRKLGYIGYGPGGKYIIQSFYISLKQDLSKYTYFQISNEYNYLHGYLDDPYPFVSIYGNAGALISRGSGLYFPPDQLFPAGLTFTREKRPRSRSIWMPTIRFVQYVPWTDGAAHFDYRFGADTWGIRSHMFELTYYQPFMERWEVVPLIRYYSQNAAKFYGPTFTVAGTPSPFPAKLINHRTFSGDYRLARFGSLNYEIKLTYKVFNQMKFGFTAGYYLRRAGYSMAKKDRIPNPENTGGGVGAKYFGVDLNFKF